MHSRRQARLPAVSLAMRLYAATLMLSVVGTLAAFAGDGELVASVTSAASAQS